MSHERDNMTDEDKVQMSLMQAAIADIKPKVDQMHAKLLSVQWCPDPGLCLRLKVLFEDHEARLRTNERRLWTAMGVCLVLSPLLAMLGSKIVDKL